MQVKKGFTLVELSLSLAFIAVLSLTVAFIVNNAVASYRRGLTLKQINTVGIGLVDDLRAAVQGSSTKSLRDDCKVRYGTTSGTLGTVTDCQNDNGRKFVASTRSANVSLRGTQKSLAVSGVFCTGTYTYLWNSGYFFTERANELSNQITSTATTPLEIVFKVSGSSVKDNEVCKKESSGNKMRCKNFRMLKMRDSSRAVCMAIAGNNYKGALSGGSIDITNTDVTEIIDETPIDLLSTDEKNRRLAMYNFNVSGPVESTAKGALFYSISFVLGTLQGNADITKTGSFCAPPDDYQVEDFDYCAINKFNFAAEATGV